MSHGRALASVAIAATLLLPQLGLASPFGVPTYPASTRERPPDDDPTVLEAKSEYRAGSDAYALGNYEDSVVHFERAYELSQKPALLFNLGQSYTRWYDISNDLEHLKKARRLYENYVLNVGATQLDEEGQAQARSDAQRRISEVDRLIAQHEDDGRSPNDEQDRGDRPVHKKAWFWLTIVGGAAVIGGVVTAVVLTRPKDVEPELGTIGRAPLEGGGLTLHF